MNLSEVRTRFGHKTRMTKNAGKYRNWHKYSGEGAKCKFCLQHDGHSHLMRCSAFAHLRSPEVCLDKDEHLVTYLRQVLRLREEREEKEQKEQKEKREKEQKEQEDKDV